MLREEFDQIEDQLMEEIAKRKRLGGYSPDAPTLEFLCRALLKLSQHLSTKMVPAKKEKS